MTYLRMYAYNFCWAVRTLRIEGADERWRERTPAMSAGLTDHAWTWSEWFAHPAAQSAWDTTGKLLLSPMPAVVRAAAHPPSPRGHPDARSPRRDFTPAGPAIDAATVGDPDLWTSRPSGHWAVTGSVSTGSPAGPSPSYLVRPSGGEPLPIGTSGRTRGVLRPRGPARAIIALTPPGGRGSSAVARGLAVNLSVPRP